MTTFADSYKNLFDFNSVDAFTKFYNLDAMQAGWKKLVDQDTFAAFQQSLEQMTDKDNYLANVEKNLHLSSELIANNTQAASDALVLQATRTRETVDGFLKQLENITQAKDAQEMFEMQRSYGESVQQAATEMARDISSIFASTLESNINLLRQATAVQTKAAASVAKKAAPVKAGAKKDAA